MGSPCVSEGEISRMDTHHGKPAVITSMSPGCGGGGSLELSWIFFGTSSSSSTPRYDLIAYRSNSFTHWLYTIVLGELRLENRPHS